MKKYIYALILLLLCINGIDSRQVQAYSVTVEKDGIYAEVIPDTFVNNTGTIFKKYVKKSMDYYNKYKDADDYTYISNVPEKYRDFIPVAKQIQDSDEIIIRNPFYIYHPMDDTLPDSYSFFAEKNGEKLCMFDIEIEPESSKLSLWYDKITDGRFTYDGKTIGETLFYVMNEIIYAETPNETSVVWDRRSALGKFMMEGGDGIDWKAKQEEADQKFRKKSYSEKKDEILEHTAGTKQEKLIKKVEENLKQELGDEYIEQEDEAEESNKTIIYIVAGAGIVLIGVIVGFVMLKKKNEE